MTRARALALALSALAWAASCRPAVPEAPARPARAHVRARLLPPRGPSEAASPTAAAPPEQPSGPEPLAALGALLGPAAQSTCNEQAPQAFLIRGNYVFDPGATAEERQARKRLHRAAIEYRTRRYGFVEEFGDPSWNAHEPKHYTAVSKFFGIRVRMNRRVLVALGCVEEAIRRDCSTTPYVPEVLDGLRLRNTFHDNEVSNHTYGIAIDIDPNKNSCCGCVPPLSEWPRCKEPAASPYERTTIPRCWVESFARFGFYWLGNDALEDTMHFEFLGDPSKIVRPPEEPSGNPGTAPAGVRWLEPQR